MNAKENLKYLGLIILLIINLSSVNGVQLENKIQEKGTQDLLPFQKAYVAQVFPNIVRKIEINKLQLQKYISKHNQIKVINNFLLHCKSIIRIGEIYVSVFTKNNNQKQNSGKVFDLNKDQIMEQSTVYSLTFLHQFNFNDIQKIIINIRSSQFTVITLSLLNNQLADQINLTQINQNEQKDIIGLIPVWLPNSYNPETDKSKKLIKYFYFKAGQHPTKLKIDRIKGHPKIFLYNCQVDKIDFCRQQIDEQHIEGTLMLQKQIQVSLIKQQHCKDCSIILAFKNMGAEISLQITQHSLHEKLVIPKDLPIFHDLRRNSSLQITSYFNLPVGQNKNDLFLDISFIEGNSSMLHIQVISVEIILNQGKQHNLVSDHFKIQNRSQAIRIKLDSKYKKFLQQVSQVKDNQIWYKIKVKISSKAHVYFTIVDENIPFGQQNFITLKDGQIYHSYIFSEQQQNSQILIKQNNLTELFKVKVSTISTLTISTYCAQFNKLQIQYYTDQSKKTKVNPKIYIENITNHNKKCSQLIHLNPNQLFSSKTQSQKPKKQTNTSLTVIHQQGQWVYFKITGVKDQIDLLFSSSDIILLQKQFFYHSQLMYNQAVFFYVPNIKNQARIKIRKCSDCQISLTYSEQQLADLKTKRTQQIITHDPSQIDNSFIYQIKGNQGIHIKVKTNNFANFAILVQQIKKENTQQVKDHFISQISNVISYSLDDENKLVLGFNVPDFSKINNLNSPIYFTLIEGSINAQVSREVYCPQFIFSQKQKTRDISLTQIIPQLIHDQIGNEKMKFIMEIKHHDFFGIRAQKGQQIFSYKVVSIQSMKQFAEYRWSIFNVLLFLTFALFMSFVCFMGLKKKRIVKIGGEVVLESQDGQQTSMVRLN